MEAWAAAADEVRATPAQVALAWAVGRSGVGPVLIGASRPEQVASNVVALEVDLDENQRRRLDEASAPAPGYPGSLFSPMVKRFVFGGNDVAGWR